MSFPQGRNAHLNFVRTASRSAVLIAALAAIVSHAQAQSALPLTMAEAEDLALAAEPGQLALAAQASALAERAVVASALPDPTLRIGLNNYPIESGGFSTEGMTQLALSYRQAFPAGKTRTLSQERFTHLADSMNENAALRLRNVRTATQKAWLELYFLDHAEKLIGESRPLFVDLADITRSLYSVGRKNQQDVLQAELQLSRLHDRLLDIARRRALTKAELAEWIGTAADREIANKFPHWSTVPPLVDLEQGLSQHPALLAAENQVHASKAAAAIADERSRPEWALDIAYGYRDGSLPSGAPRSDFATVGVTVGLPFFNRKSVDSSLTAALHEHSAARSAKQQLERELQRELGAAHAEWLELSRRIALYDSNILQQSKSHADAALLAYQSDAGDFADVMRANVDYLNIRIEYLRLIVDRAKSYAMLANLGGLTP